MDQINKHIVSNVSSIYSFGWRQELQILKVRGRNEICGVGLELEETGKLMYVEKQYYFMHFSLLVFGMMHTPIESCPFYYQSHITSWLMDAY